MDHVEKSLKSDKAAVVHPLEPLSVREIQTTVDILRRDREIGQSHRFVEVSLKEPSKATVLAFRVGEPVNREARVILLDKADGATYEAVVSITSNEVKSWQHIPGVQPALMPDEIRECEEAVKKDPRWQAALERRGITDFDRAFVEGWPAGALGAREWSGRRLVRPLTFIRDSPDEVGYGSPVENVIAVVDLNSMEVLNVEDHGVVPVPPRSGNWTARSLDSPREDLKPLDIVQPEGPSFEVDGHEIRWQKWRIRFGFNAREGLVLHTVGYEDQGRERPILYRASISEMVVPYGDPSATHNNKSVFDLGEGNVGTLANSLKLGCDCLGVIRYFDAALGAPDGEPYTIENAICLHEEDHGTLWKHTDGHTGHVEVRRSRRLVLSFFATVGNYDYGFYWYFYQDGSIEFESKLTGALTTGALAPGERTKYSPLIAPQLTGPIHQHFFNARLDMMVDGLANSVVEVNTEAEPPGPANPVGNAFFAVTTTLSKESEAQRLIDPLRGRYWKVVNESATNHVDEPVGYKLVPGENVVPFAQPDSSMARRAGFLNRHLWVTPYDSDERYAAGDYPNQHPGEAGLPQWTKEDRPILDTDIVVWYTFGVHHVPRSEDWPVMPVHHAGFRLEPVGFFDANPSMDVPPPDSLHGSCCH